MLIFNLYHWFGTDQSSHQISSFHNLHRVSLLNILGIVKRFQFPNLRVLRLFTRRCRVDAKTTESNLTETSELDRLRSSGTWWPV